MGVIPFGKVCTDADSRKGLGKGGLKPSRPLEFDIGTDSPKALIISRERSVKSVRRSAHQQEPALLAPKPFIIQPNVARSDL